MKLFLDAHISRRGVATQLRDRGHDVRSADEERDLDGSSDEQLLSLAADEGRVFITFDVKDFPVIARRWAESGRRHAGCAIVVGIDHGEFGAIVNAIERELRSTPDAGDWIDRTLFIARVS